MIEISSNDYFLGQWFSESKNFANIMALIRRGDNEKTWVGTIRYRIYADEGRDDPFSGKDRKQFFDIKKEDMTEDQMIEYMNKLFDHLGECPSLEHKLGYDPFICDHVIIKGDFQKMLDECGKKPWFHVKTEDKINE